MPKFIVSPDNKVIEKVTINEAASLMSRGWREAGRAEVVAAIQNGTLIDDRE